MSQPEKTPGAPSPAHSGMRLSFVYPMYNEIGNIEKVIRASHALGAKLAREFEIVVVDDCSTDGSGALADRLAGEFAELRVIHHERNRKLGGALKTGFAAARMDYILYMDSDLPVAFEDVEACLREIELPLDMLVGYRIGRAEGIFRDVQSWSYNALLKMVFGLKVRDANFAFKLFRRELVARPPRSEGSFIDAELLLEALRRGCEIRERGFRYHVRTAGVSTLGGPRVVPQLLGDLVHYRLRRWKRPPDGSRRVIFNADGFGHSAGANAGVIESHEKGVIGCASIMPAGGAFEEAAAYARENKTLDTGLHLALCDGRPVCGPGGTPSLVEADGNFCRGHAAFLKRYFGGKIDLGDVEREFRAQLAKARAAGVEISHLDSHLHLHALPAVLEIMIRLAREHKIPVARCPDERDVEVVSAALEGRAARSLRRIGDAMKSRPAKRLFNSAGIAATDHFAGAAEAGGWNVKLLRQTIFRLRPGVTEICCHPRSGAEAEPERDRRYNAGQEMLALVDAQVRQFLEEEEVRVTTFRECFGG